ncbi:MAG: spore cortex-lytic protein [Oscillospiraceae bacterium]|nr:spore cortex-lytic protein [Oscillospiraceae bacterium]
MKGGVILSAKGYIQVRAYTSYAQIPLEGVAVSVTDPEGATIALRLTNRNGALDIPIEVIVPDFSAGQRPDTDTIPFGVVNLYARLNNYEAIEIENLQVFPDRTTTQNLEMIPLSELPDSYNKLEIFPTPPQNL